MNWKMIAIKTFKMLWAFDNQVFYFVAWANPGVRRLGYSRRSRCGVAGCATNLASSDLKSNSARLKHISSSGQPFCTDYNATPHLYKLTKNPWSSGNTSGTEILHPIVQKPGQNLISDQELNWSSFEKAFGVLGYQWCMRTQVENWKTVPSRSVLADLVQSR